MDRSAVLQCQHIPSNSNRNVVGVHIHQHIILRRYVVSSHTCTIHLIYTLFCTKYSGRCLAAVCANLAPMRKQDRNPVVLNLHVNNRLPITKGISSTTLIFPFTLIIELKPNGGMFNAPT